MGGTTDSAQATGEPDATIEADPDWEPGHAFEFERAKAAFDQNFEQFRHLNDQMNRIPAFAVTLTAGFWYVAVVSDYGGTLGAVEEKLARFALMLFAGICDAHPS